MFIDPDSEQEMLEHDLFPRDFIYALEAPSNYIGARNMFGEDAPYGIMLESNDDCEQALPIKHKKDSPSHMQQTHTHNYIGKQFKCQDILRTLSKFLLIPKIRSFMSLAIHLTNSETDGLILYTLSTSG